MGIIQNLVHSSPYHSRTNCAYEIIHKDLIILIMNIHRTYKTYQ